MGRRLKSLAAPILVIALGTGWLLSVQQVAPGVDWIWTLGLGVTGLLIVWASFDKVTAVVGPFLLAASCLSILRQTGRLNINAEVPVLVIVFGTLMLLAKLLPIPRPKWIADPPAEEK